MKVLKNIKEFSKLDLKAVCKEARAGFVEGIKGYGNPAATFGAIGTVLGASVTGAASGGDPVMTAVGAGIGGATGAIAVGIGAVASGCTDAWYSAKEEIVHQRNQGEQTK